MQKSILKPLLTITIIFIIVGVFVFFLNSRNNISENIKNNNVVQTISLEQDVYPLYLELNWRTPRMHIIDLKRGWNEKLEGYKSTSRQIIIKNNPDMYINFYTYYDDKLKALGYSEGEIGWSGVSSNVWSYEKNSNFVVLSYDEISTQSYLDQDSGEMVHPFVFGVFTGKLVADEE